MRGSIRRFLRLAAAVCLAFCLLGGCALLSPEREEEEQPHGNSGAFRLPEPPPLPPEAGDVRIGMLYYPDAQWRFLVPVQRAIPFTEAIACSTLERLVASPALESELAPPGLTATLPEHTAVRGISINEGLARVDFSASFLEYPPEHERLVLGGVLSTLLQFPNIERLEIMVEGANLEQFPGGAPGRIPLGPEDWINLEVDSALEDYRSFTAVKIYFCYLAPNGWIFYVPVTRVLPQTEDEALAAITELLKGPRRGSGLFSDIPAGTGLLGLNLTEGLLEVDLTTELLAYEGGRTGAENVVNQLRLTLGALDGVAEMQILVEGEAVTLKDGPDLSGPLAPLERYNYF